MDYVHCSVRSSSTLHCNGIIFSWVSHRFDMRFDFVHWIMCKENETNVTCRKNKSLSEGAFMLRNKLHWSINVHSKVKNCIGKCLRQLSPLNPLATILLISIWGGLWDVQYHKPLTAGKIFFRVKHFLFYVNHNEENFDKIIDSMGYGYNFLLVSST